MSAADDKLAIILRDSPDLWCPQDIIPGTPLDQLPVNCRPNFDATAQNGFILGPIAQANPATGAGNRQVERIGCFGGVAAAAALATAIALPAPYAAILPVDGIYDWAPGGGNLLFQLSSATQPVALRDIIVIRYVALTVGPSAAVALGAARLHISDDQGDDIWLPLVGGESNRVTAVPVVYQLVAPVTLRGTDFVTSPPSASLDLYGARIEAGNPHVAGATANAVLTMLIDIYRGANT